jgi:hypothetical protein
MDQATHYYLIFETAGGFCGIAWNSVGITRFQLPTWPPGATIARLTRSGSQRCLSLWPDRRRPTPILQPPYIRGGGILSECEPAVKRAIPAKDQPVIRRAVFIPIFFPLLRAGDRLFERYRRSSQT